MIGTNSTTNYISGSSSLLSVPFLLVSETGFMGSVARELDWTSGLVSMMLLSKRTLVSLMTGKSETSVSLLPFYIRSS